MNKQKEFRVVIFEEKGAFVKTARIEKGESRDAVKEKYLSEGYKPHQINIKEI